MTFLAFYKHVNDIFFKFTCFSHDCHVFLHSSKINNRKRLPFSQTDWKCFVCYLRKYFHSWPPGSGSMLPWKFQKIIFSETTISRIFVSVAEWSYNIIVWNKIRACQENRNIFLCTPNSHKCLMIPFRSSWSWSPDSGCVKGYLCTQSKLCRILIALENRLMCSIRKLGL